MIVRDAPAPYPAVMLCREGFPVLNIMMLLWMPALGIRVMYRLYLVVLNKLYGRKFLKSDGDGGVVDFEIGGRPRWRWGAI